MKRARLTGTLGKSFRNAFEQWIWVDELNEMVELMKVMVGVKTSDQA